MCKDGEHNEVVMETKLYHEATQEDGHHEVPEVKGHHKEITSIGVEIEAKVHQEEITTTEVVTEANMVVETRDIQILVETKTRREVECGGVQTEGPTKIEDIMTIINAHIQALKMVIYL